MGPEENWQEFVKFVRQPAVRRVQDFVKEVLDEGFDNFLFIANGSGEDPVIVRGMHYPDSDILDAGAGCTVFETSEKNIYLAAYRSSAIKTILEKIESNFPEELHVEIWEQAVEVFVNEAQAKIMSGDVSPLF